LFVLLGLNCAYGSSDIAALPITAIDLDAGWIAYARGKTGIPRRCSLWPETITALREAVNNRPTPRDEQDASLAFLTERGNRWVRSYAKDKTKGATPDDEIGKEFRKLLGKLGLNRKGLGFYALRHTFRTVADECGDFPAIDLVMGHGDTSMGARYRERIDDSRLEAVAHRVRNWLFGTVADGDGAHRRQDGPRLRVVGAG
jgi:integrase